MASSLSAANSRHATWRIDASRRGADRDTRTSQIARWLTPGDLLTLSGELGAGKTAFARALIRSLTGDADLEVPSPTFTLMQIYDGRRFSDRSCRSLSHRDPDELAELGWDEAAEGALVLVEWPDRAGARLPPTGSILPCSRPDAGRRLPQSRALTGYGAFAARLDIARAVHNVLADPAWPMPSDSSCRAMLRPALRTARQARWRHGHIDDFAAAPGRPADPLWQIL